MRQDATLDGSASAGEPLRGAVARLSDDTTRSARGDEKRQQIIDAAADLLRELGPNAVSHRAVAKAAGCSLSATTYYFDGLEDLLHQAGRVNISRWASRAERVAEKVEGLPTNLSFDERCAFILEATIPRDELLLGHYAQLINAGSSDPVSRAYRTGRSRLSAAITRVVTHFNIPVSADLIITLVDGAAVTALSEDRNVYDVARTMLRELAHAIGTDGDACSS